MASDPNVLLRALLAFSLALGMVLVLRVPLRRVLGARAAYALWWLPVLALVASLLPAPPAGEALGVMAPFELLADANARSSAIVSASGLREWLALAWHGGAAVLAVLLAGIQHDYRRRLQVSARDVHGVVRSDRLAGPALVGAWKPLLVLPSDFEDRYPPAERALVLAHEAAHQRRGDPAANALAALLLCVFWFNPLAWWALGRFRFDQELACDEDVLATHPGSRRDYAAALLKSQLAADTGWRLPAGCHWAARHPLKERITMLKRPTPARLQRLSGAALVLCLGTLASYGAWAGGVSAPEVEQPRRLHRLVAADHMPPPAYPPEALKQGLSGKVVLKILVTKQGRVDDVRIISPPSEFDQAAIDAARQWTFVPGRDDGGRPLEGWVEVPVMFEQH